MKITNIFSRATFIARAKKKAKEEDYHLVDAGKELAKEVAWAYAIYYGLWLLVVLGLLAVLSFTSLLGGPFVVAQVIFFLIVGSILLAALSLWRLWVALKRRLHELNPLSGTENDSGDDDVYDSEVVDGRLADDQRRDS